MSFLDIRFEMGTENLYLGRRYMKRFEAFPPQIWNRVEGAFKALTRHTARRISRFSVKPATRRWRKSMHDHNRRVETYVGEYKVPLKSPRVGRRTGTFLDSFRESKEPGVTVDTSGAGVFGLANGRFIYRINTENFAKALNYGYPVIFEQYLIKRGILSFGGFLGLNEAQEEYIFDLLDHDIDEYVMGGAG